MNREKLERLPEYVLSTVTILLGIAFALYAGSSLGKGEFKFVLVVVVAIPLVLAAVHFRTRLWLLIPLVSGIGGYIVSLPLGLPPRSLITLYVFAAFLAFKALKISRTKPPLEVLDMIVLVNLLYMVSVFARNPVGALGMGSERIGGRPYFQVAIAYFGYWVLSRVTLSSKTASKLPVLMLITPFFDGFAGFLGDKFPQIAQPLGGIYSSFATFEMQNPYGAPPGDELNVVEGSRLAYLSPPGAALGRCLVSYFNPITLINPLYIGRFLLFLISVVFLLSAGYRSAFASMAYAMALGAYFRDGFRQVFTAALLLVPVILVLVLGQGILFNLPIAAQRTLSFLPGRWNEDAVLAAQGSTLWRMDMWKDALTTDRYIHNKILGDGFGVEREVWEAVQEGKARGITQALQAEEQAIMGGFHNGPISAIRIVGYVGMILYGVLLCAVAHKAWVLIRLAKNTPFFPFALFVGIPILITASTYFIGGGNFDPDFEQTILGAGMMKLLGASLAVEESVISVPKESPRLITTRSIIPFTAKH